MICVQYKETGQCKKIKRSLFKLPEIPPSRDYYYLYSMNIIIEIFLCMHREKCSLIDKLLY